MNTDNNIFVDHVEQIEIKVVDKNGDSHTITYSDFDKDEESVSLHQEKEIFPPGRYIKINLDFKCRLLEINWVETEVLTTQQRTR